MRYCAAMLCLVLFMPVSAQEAGKSPVLASTLQAFVDSGELSGVVTFVGDKDGVRDVQVLGLADIESKAPMKRNTLFRIASMSKPITVLALMLLVEAGLVDVEDPVEKYLPEFKGQMLLVSKAKDQVTLKRPNRPIAIKDLMTHTSGLPSYPAGLADVYTKRHYNLSETTVAISQAPLMFEPGTKWSYCNPGIDTIGRIIEVVSGMPYETFLAKRIFEPLGMVDTTPYPSGEQLKRLAVTYGKKGEKLFRQMGVLALSRNARHPVPAGGLYSTGDDLARLYECLLNKGVYKGRRIVGEKTLADMTSIHTGDMKAGFIDGSTWGYGFAIVKEAKGATESLSPGSYGHGGAYGTQGWIDPSRGIYTILLIQRIGLAGGDASAIRKALHDASVSLVK